MYPVGVVVVAVVAVVGVVGVVAVGTGASPNGLASIELSSVTGVGVTGVGVSGIGVTKVVPPVVVPVVDPPVVVPVVALVEVDALVEAVPFGVMTGVVGPDCPLKFLSKKNNPTIRPISKRAPRRYQIHDGHPPFLVFFF